MQHKKTVTLRERYYASLLHLALSAFILSSSIYIVFFIWYPDPLNMAVGVAKIYITILLADLVIGPLLTFIVYKHDKKRMRIDLAIILSMQIIAFLYGMHTVEQGRPVWLVFVVDDFELVSPANLDQRNIETLQTDFKASFWSGPQWIAAQYSKDPDIQQQQKEDEMFLGISLATRLETYAPIEQARQAILERSKLLKELKSFNHHTQVEQVLNSWPQATAWLPLKAPEQDMVVLINTQGTPLATVNLKPWD